MLHRANSDAGNRLRRAKSGSSIHQRRSEPIQAPLHPEHASVAAIEAYRRAFQASTDMPPRMGVQHPGRPRAKGKSEGVHFEENRNGRRIDRAKTNHDAEAQLKKPDRHNGRQTNERTAADGDVTRTIMQPRRAIDTTPQNRSGSHESSSQPQSRLIRKSKSMQYDQHQVRYTPLAEKPIQDKHVLRKKTDCVSIQHTPQSCQARATSVPRPLSPHVDGAGSAEDKDRARDDLLQATHKRRLRTSTSFTDPFMRKFSRATSRAGSTIAYDNTVPPFNLGHETVESVPPIPKIPSNVHVNEALPKQRNVSDSIKNKFRRIFGKEKRVQTAFPAQHVAAKQFHFDVYTPDPEEESFHLPYPRRPPPSPPAGSRPDSADDTRKYSSQSTDTAINSQMDRSRVTSWTDSTVAGTIRSVGNPKRLSSINELPSRVAKANASSPERSSMLGRALRLPHRKPSRQSSMRTSTDSQKLYDALRGQIRDKPWVEPNTGVVLGDETISPEAENAYPKKVELSAPCDTGHQPAAHSPTIRTVTPENFQHKSEQVCEGADRWEPPAQESSQLDADRRARRQQRAANRWQETLNGESPMTSRALKASAEYNPYKLGSLPTSPQADYLPIAIRHAEPKCEPFSVKTTDAASRVQTISPSVYSRETDGPRSTRSNSPMPNIGTIVTITGREVKRYSLDSPDKKKSRMSRGQASQD